MPVPTPSPQNSGPTHTLPVINPIRPQPEIVEWTRKLDRSLIDSTSATDESKTFYKYGENGVDTLIMSLNHPNSWVKFHVIAAFKYFKGVPTIKKALPYLEVIVNDVNEKLSTRQAAQLSIKIIQQF